MNYRKDIDGLRAVAVLAVLIYHGFPTLLPGGFIGVDVFFVISGFLITSIISRDLSLGKFSLGRFYDRRIRRILPALMVVIIFTALTGWIGLVPVLEYKELSQSIASIGLFASNMFFWYKLDYFAQASELQPLLHTWSLSVEEQFYFIWPLLLILLFKFKDRISPFKVITILTVLSLGLSQFLLSKDISASFYWAPSRFWELAIGGLLALLPEHQSKNIKFLGYVQALALMGLVACFLLIDSESHFPGVTALFPVSFSVILVRYGNIANTFVSKILTVSPMVFTGKISYSLYLWHWPLLVFGKIYYGQLSSDKALLLLALSYVLSVCSWKYIEGPFRRIQWKRTYVFSFLFAGSTVIMLTVFGYFGHKTWGYPGRLDSHLSEVAKTLKNSPHFSCGNLNQGVIGNGTPQIALWGDSHAADLCPAMHELAKSASLSTINYIETSCLPLVYPGGLSFQKKCRSAEKLNIILKNKEITSVVLAGEWPSDGSSAQKNVAPALKYTLRMLVAENKKVAFVGDVPVYQSNIPTCKLRSKMLEPYGLDVPCDSDWLDSSDQDRKQKYLKSHIAAINRESEIKIEFIDRMAVFCNGSKCLSYQNQLPLYRDSNHLTVPGSLLALPMINKSLKTH